MTDNQSFVDKFRPDNWKEFQGNNKSIKQIREWGKDWTSGDSPILLHGEPGTGKTTAAILLSKEFDWPMLEINASDSRRKEDIIKIAGLMDDAPYGNNQLILLDEVDSLGKGSLNPLLNRLKNPRNPTVLTCNDLYSVPQSVKSKCKEYKFKLSKSSKKAKLRKIIEQNDFDVSAKEHQLLSGRSDLRAAINDLQLFVEGDYEIKEDERGEVVSDFDAVDNILKGKVGIESDTDPTQFIYWLDENLRSNQSDIGMNYRDLQGVEVPLMYNALANADINIQNSNELGYGLWYYANEVLENVGRLRLTEPFMPSRIPKSFPSFFRWKKKTVNSGSPEAKLYLKLKGSTGYSFASNFVEFREIILPILRDLDDEEKMNMCIDNNVEGNKLLQVLDIDPKEYENYKIGDFEEVENDTGVLDF